MHLTVDQCLNFFVLFLFLVLFVCLFCFCLFLWVFCLSLSQQIYICVLFGESPGFSPRWEFSHFPSSHFVQFTCAQCGGPRGVGAPGWTSSNYQATQPKVFRGLSLFQPPICIYFSLYFYFPSFFLKLKIQAPKLSVTGRRIA